MAEGLADNKKPNMVGLKSLETNCLFVLRVAFDHTWSKSSSASKMTNFQYTVVTGRQPDPNYGAPHYKIQWIPDLYLAVFVYLRVYLAGCVSANVLC